MAWRRVGVATTRLCDTDTSIRRSSSVWMSGIGDGHHQDTAFEAHREHAPTPAEGLGKVVQDGGVGGVEAEIPVGHPAEVGQRPGQVVFEQHVVGHQDLAQPPSGTTLLGQSEVNLLRRHQAGGDQLDAEWRLA